MMKKHIFNQSILQFLKDEVRFLLIVLSGIALWSLFRSYFSYRTPDFFSWEYILGLVIAYPFISFLNRRYLKL